MKKYICDNKKCQKQMLNPEITLTGYKNPNLGGLLLAPVCIELDFCSDKCLKEYVCEE